MGLRDEILHQQELEEEKLKAEQKTAKKKPATTQTQPQEKTVDAAQKTSPAHPPVEKYKQEFEALRAALDKNEIPEEWVAIRKEAFEKLTPILKDLKEKTFSFRYDITKKQYSKFFYEGDAGKYSPGILLNQYLSKCLETEGFFNAELKMTSYISYFSTPEDEKAHQSLIDHYNDENGRLLDQYHKELAAWSAKNSIYQDYLRSNDGGINPPSSPGRYPTYPSLKTAPPIAKSGQKVNYCIMAKGDLLDATEMKKHNKATKKAKKKAAKQAEKEKNKGKKKTLHPILIGLIIMGGGLLLVLLGIFIFPDPRNGLFELFKTYPLTSWANAAHYSAYWKALGASLIPGGVFLGGKFVFWVFEKLIERFG